MKKIILILMITLSHTTGYAGGQCSREAASTEVTVERKRDVGGESNEEAGISSERRANIYTLICDNVESDTIIEELSGNERMQEIINRIGELYNTGSNIHDQSSTNPYVRILITLEFYIEHDLVKDLIRNKKITKKKLYELYNQLVHIYFQLYKSGVNPENIIKIIKIIFNDKRFKKHKKKVPAEIYSLFGTLLPGTDMFGFRAEAAIERAVRNRRTPRVTFNDAQRLKKTSIKAGKGIEGYKPNKEVRAALTKVREAAGFFTITEESE